MMKKDWVTVNNNKSGVFVAPIVQVATPKVQPTTDQAFSTFMVFSGFLSSTVYLFVVWCLAILRCMCQYQTRENWLDDNKSLVLFFFQSNECMHAWGRLDGLWMGK